MRLLGFPVKNDIFPFFVLLIFTPLFFYNLSGHSLVDFDEAWYATIAANIIKNHDPITLEFNSAKFIEHPPLGFNLIALSLLIFGHNEFAARLPSALSAFGSAIVLYLTGKALFNKFAGLAASLFLVSSVWFVYRARTADLDSFFLFCYLFTFYAAVKSRNNHIWLYILSISMAVTLLVKSFFGLTLLLPILIIFLQMRKKPCWDKLLTPFLLFLAIVLLFGFLILQANGFNVSVFSRYLLIGLKRDGMNISNILNITETNAFRYLHFGIQKWFYLAAPALIGSLIFIRKQPVLVVLYVWAAILFTGFATNNKAEIWHLIPLYIPLALITGNFYFQLKEYIRELISERFENWKMIAGIFSTLYLLAFLTVAVYQINGFKNGIKLFGGDLSPVAYLAEASKEYSLSLYLDTETYVPAVASFYSGKDVTVFRLRPQNNTLLAVLTNEGLDFVLITEKWKLELDKIPSEDYVVLNEFNGHMLISPVEKKK